MFRALRADEIISTHTPLARRDYSPRSFPWTSWNFYSHASCEARLRSWRGCGNPAEFLLTRLLRGATAKMVDVGAMCRISTHTPLARRDDDPSAYDVVTEISTHTPLARRDKDDEYAAREADNFYSHASCEARRSRLDHYQTTDGFLLTRLLRGATVKQITLCP